MKRTMDQRESYAVCRMCAALDRFIETDSMEEQELICRWIKAWHDEYLTTLTAKKSYIGIKQIINSDFAGWSRARH
jgi:hypothetical protein